MTNKEPRSFNNLNLKVGTNTAKLSWGIHRLKLRDSVLGNNIAEDLSSIELLSLVSFSQKMQTKVIQDGASTDFIGEKLFCGEIDPSVRDSTEYYIQRGSINPVPRYKISNNGSSQIVEAHLPFSEGIYRNIQFKAGNIKNRPWEHGAINHINFQDTVRLISEGSPLISSASHGFATLVIQDNVSKDVMSAFMYNTVPQHNFDIRQVHFSPQLSESLTDSGRDIIRGLENGNLDANGGDVLWGGN